MENVISIEDLRELAQKLFETQNVWDVVKNGKIAAGYDVLTKIEKAVALKMVCQNQYTEDQIAYIRLTEDLTSGFALTVDSFCAGGKIKTALIKYTDIKSAVAYKDADMEEDGTCNLLYYGLKINDDCEYKSGEIINRLEEMAEEEDKLFGTDLKFYKALAKFLNLVKEL